MRTSTKFLAALFYIILLAGVSAPALAVNTSGYTVAIPCVYEDTIGFRGSVAPVQYGGKYGLIDKTGNTVTPFVYDSFTLLWSQGSNDFQHSYLVAIQDGKWGVIDETGRLLIPCIYNSIVSGGNGMAIVGIGEPARPGLPNLNGVWGLVDIQTGREILPVKYRDISPSDDSLVYTVNLDNKTAVTDRNGKFIVPLGTYDIITNYYSGLATVYKNQKVGIIDQFGRAVTPVVYDRIDPFQSGVTLANKDGKWGVLNTFGETVVPFIYGDGGVYPNGVIQMRKGAKPAVFDRTGRVIAPLGKYDFVHGSTGNLIYVERGGKMGAIDITGQEIVPLIYTGIRDITNGLAVVIDNDKCTIINQSGQAILPLDKYGGTLDENGFFDGYGINILDDGYVLILSTESKWGLIDCNGTKVLPGEYFSIGNMNDGYVAVQNEKGYALFNKDGQVIVSFGDFDSIGNINENMASVTKDGLTGFISLPEYIAPPDGWAKPEVDCAIAAGLVPEDMRRKYQDNITRADFCRLAANLIEVKTGMKVDVFMNTRGMSGRISDPIPFTDTNDPVIIAASRLGIVYGVGNNRFDPSGIISRQDAAVMLQRTAMVLDFTEPQGIPQEFADSGRFSNYAVNAIAFVSMAEDTQTGYKIMGGTGNNNFSPLSPYTRQQAYATILRLYNAFKVSGGFV